MDVRYIYWFCYYNPSEPSVRYRAIYALDQLEKECGIKSAIVYPGYRIKNILHFSKVYFSVLLFRKSGSVIVFQKIHSARIYSFALRILLLLRKRNTIYDIDDADYLRFRANVIRHFMKNCEACTAGSEEIKRYAGKYNSNTFLLTSPVIRHNKIKKHRSEIFTIGWIGYYNAHRENLHTLLFPAIAALDFEIRLVILGVVKPEHKREVHDLFSGNKNVCVELPDDVDWQDEASVYDRISEFDVGVAPLLDNEFNRAKSAFKLKQCLSCGVPVLASRVGEHIAFLEDGVNGFFCNTPADYKKMLGAILDMNEREYEMLSTNARRSAENFSMQRFCDTLLAAIK